MEVPKTVLESIYEWSLNKPLWQRDALRRIIQKGTISDNDLAELFSLLKAAHLDDDNANLVATPLTLEHIPSHTSTTENVWLENISNVKGVNNLALEQTLNFEQNGITVIYGDNGAGKSGYTRILKSVCRARHRSEILSNIYATEPQESPTALIKYGSGTQSSLVVNWENSDKPDPTLSAVSVFDRECASVHLKKKNKVAYRPYGLDVPDVLAACCKQLEGKLKEELQGLERTKNDLFLNPPWQAVTKVGQAISKLSAKTKTSSLEALSLITAEEAERHTQLNETLSKNVKKAATEQKNKADNIKALLEFVKTLSCHFDDMNLDEIITLKTSASSAKEAANLAAQNAFSKDLLPEVGGDTWKKLWESARNYSISAPYADMEFPYVGDESQCVLCQQPLTDEAKTRLQSFEVFLKGDLENKAKEAETKFTQVYSKLPQNIDLTAYRTTLQEIKLHNIDLYRSTMKFFASVRLRKIHLLKKFDNPEQNLETLLNNKNAELQKLEENHRKLAAELEQAIDEEKLSALKSEKQELSDRLVLHAHFEAIKTEIERLKSIELINLCIAETKTRNITSLGNSIADDVITPQLRDRFLKEIIELVGNRFRVEVLRSGGNYGTPEYKVSLLSDPKRDVSTILSEGEQTCVAIASFLAELATTSHNSALVFDDPISSLDHKWRSIVAERLVKEAKERQVIIFTHDLIFLNDLEDFADRQSVAFSSSSLDRMPEMVGLVNTSLPWDGMKIAARIDALEKEARQLQSDRSNLTEEGYRSAARQFYSRLRASWERGLEEVGLAHTVMRHRDYINAKNIKKISVLEESDCDIWQENFGKCCDFVEAHDGSRGRNQTLPEPDVLLSDVATLNKWVRDLKDKQKALK